MPEVYQPAPEQSLLVPLEELDTGETARTSIGQIEAIGNLVMHGSGLIPRVEVGHEIVVGKAHEGSLERLMNPQDAEVAYQSLISDGLAKQAESNYPIASTSETVSLQSRGSMLLELGVAFRNANSKGYYSSYKKIDVKPMSDGATDRYQKLITVREPVPITDSEIEGIASEPDGDKYPVIAELLDPYRWRADADAPESESQTRAHEQEQVMTLLRSLDNGTEKELSLVSAWELFSRLDNQNQQYAQEVLGMMTEDTQRLIMAAESEIRTPEQILAEVGKYSGAEAKRLEDILASSMEGKVEVEPGSDYRVVVGLPRDALIRTLFDTHQLLTVQETKVTGTTGGHVQYLRMRREQEEKMGFSESGDVSHPRAIYGSLMNDQEIYGPHIGGIGVVLKPEATDRSTFHFGDSLGRDGKEEGEATVKDLMLFEDVKPVKDMHYAIEKHNTKGSVIPVDPDRVRSFQSAMEPTIENPIPVLGRYIEAQVHGGVDVGDIEELVIPFSIAQGTNENAPLISLVRENYHDLPITVTISSEKLESNGGVAVFEKLAKDLRVKFVVQENDGSTFTVGTKKEALAMAA